MFNTYRVVNYIEDRETGELYYGSSRQYNDLVQAMKRFDRCGHAYIEDFERCKVIASKGMGKEWESED